jgi:hypothetical protein
MNNRRNKWLNIELRRKPYLVRDILIAAVALSTLASPASAQAAHEFFGPPTPLIFDAEGARHWCLYGNEPFTPPMTSKDSNIISCQMGFRSGFFWPFHHHLFRQKIVLGFAEIPFAVERH